MVRPVPMPMTTGSGRRSQRSISAAAICAMPSVSEVEAGRWARFRNGEVVSLPQRRGEFHAARDRMVEPHLDQPFADRQRDEALRGLARNAELARDLVLGVAGDVIEPAGARGVVEPARLAFRFRPCGLLARAPR